MGNARQNSFWSGSAWSVGAAVTAGIINYFVRRQMALGVTEAELGFFYGAVSLISLLIAFADFGLNNVILLRLSETAAKGESDKARRLFTLAFVLKGAIALFLSLILIFSSEWLSEKYFKYPGGGNLLKLMSLYLIGYALFTYGYYVGGAFCRFRFGAGLQIFGFGSWLVLLTVGFYWRPGKLLVAVLAMVLPFVVGTVGWICLLRREVGWRKWQAGDTLELWNLVKWFALGSVGASAMMYTDSLSIAWLMRPEDVGIYSIAVSISQFAQPLLLGAMVIVPVAAKLEQKGEQAALDKLILQVFGVFIVLLVAAFGGAYFLGGWLIEFLFDAKFLGGKTALTFLLPAMVANAFGVFLVGILNVRKRYVISNILILGVLAVNLALNRLFIGIWGISGAGAATLGGYVLLSLVAFSMIIQQKKEK